MAWAAVITTALTAACGSSGSRQAPVSPSALTGNAPESLIVNGESISRPVADGFLGLSIEQWAVESYAGTDPAAINPVLVRLIRNLTPRQVPVLRLAGVSTDRTWWPIPGTQRPEWVKNKVDARWAAVTDALAQALGARLILGVNFEADGTGITSTEAQHFDTAIGHGRIEGLELGNEPELYGSWTWYVDKHGRHVHGRAAGYDPSAYVGDVARLRGALPPLPLVGPASGSNQWMAQLPQLIAGEPGLSLVTVHRYPLQACYFPTGSPRYPTIANLLAPHASIDLAQSVSGYVSVAHSHQLPLRIDEMNAVSCGRVPALQNSFALALWVLDALLADVQVGADGVNIHTYPSSIGQLFTMRFTGSGWRATVEPEYYGLLMFEQAAPPGSRLMQVSGPPGDSGLRVWATRAPDGKVRVVMINADTVHRRILSLRVAGAGGSGQLERLQAPSPGSSGQVSLGGRTFGTETTTGQLTGITRSTTLSSSGGTFQVDVPAASAAMLTIG